MFEGPAALHLKAYHSMWCNKGFNGSLFRCILMHSGCLAQVVCFCFFSLMCGNSGFFAYFCVVWLWSLYTLVAALVLDIHKSGTRHNHCAGTMLFSGKSSSSSSSFCTVQPSTCFCLGVGVAEASPDADSTPHCIDYSTLHNTPNCTYLWLGHQLWGWRINWYHWGIRGKEVCLALQFSAFPLLNLTHWSAAQVGNIRSDAMFILLVEKDAAFMRLAEDRFYNTYPCIIVTAKGQPDVATRWVLASHWRPWQYRPQAAILGCAVSIVVVPCVLLLVQWGSFYHQRLCSSKFCSCTASSVSIETQNISQNVKRWCGVCDLSASLHHLNHMVQ